MCFFGVGWETIPRDSSKGGGGGQAPNPRGRKAKEDGVDQFNPFQ